MSVAGAAVEDERLSQDLRIAAVLLQPHLVGHHEDGRRARRGVGNREGAAEYRRHSEERERVGGDEATDVKLGPLAGREQHILAGAADDLLEDLILLLVLEELGDLKCAPAARLG